MFLKLKNIYDLLFEIQSINYFFRIWTVVHPCKIVWILADLNLAILNQNIFDINLCVQFLLINLAVLKQLPETKLQFYKLNLKGKKTVLNLKSY